jgi:hypothetical protein
MNGELAARANFKRSDPNVARNTLLCDAASRTGAFPLLSHLYSRAKRTMNERCPAFVQPSNLIGRSAREGGGRMHAVPSRVFPVTQGSSLTAILSFWPIHFFLWFCVATSLGSAASADDESEQHEWESGLHAPVKWSAVMVHGAVMKRVPQVYSEFDARGREPKKTQELITITATSPLHGITAFRVEILPDPADDARKPKPVQAKFQVVTLDTKTGIESQQGFAMTTSSFPDPYFVWNSEANDDPRTGWVLATGANKTAFQLARRIEGGMGTRFALSFSVIEGELNLNRLRIFATTHTQPVLEVPESIQQTIALEPTERTDEQRRELTAFFKSVRAKSSLDSGQRSSPTTDF